MELIIRFLIFVLITTGVFFFWSHMKSEHWLVVESIKKRHGLAFLTGRVNVMLLNPWTNLSEVVFQWESDLRDKR